MKKHLLLMACMMPFIGMSQVADDFGDGNFTADPAWGGDTSQFEVNSAKQLHLRTTGADTAVLTTPNSLVNNTEWDIWLKLSFNTSVNNHARVYLVADKADLAPDLNGYYLQVGGSNDSIEFVRQTGASHVVLFTAKTAYTGNSVNILRIKVIHDKSGTWHLYTDNSGNSNFREEGTCTDNLVQEVSCFGISCRFTSSNSTKFYFDDFYAGPVIIDSVAPTLLSVAVDGANRLNVTFSEPIDEADAANISNYFVPGHGNPTSASLDSLKPATVRLGFESSFANGTCDTLFVNHIGDIHGNQAGTLSHSFCLYRERSFDVVISEIMADPTPQTGLPDAEYVELHNRTGYPISLEDWTFTAGTTVKTLSAVTIGEHGFLTLTKGTILGFYGPSVDLFTSSSTLTNDGSTLVLKNKENKVIHSVTYSAGWYRNSMKEDGGWSLEMIDPGNPCGCAENWTASENELGGSPGSLNSVNRSNPDTVSPYLQRARVENDSTIRLLFSETIDSTTFPVPGSWAVEGGELQVTGLVMVPPAYDQLGLRLSMAIEPGVLYKVAVPAGIADCPGNQLEPGKTVQFALPDTISVSDVIINEILPNPYPNGERFLEIFNRSPRIFDLKNLVMLEADSLSEEGFRPVSITDESFLFFPGQYLVLSKDPSDILSRYSVPDPDCLVGVGSIPGMTKDESGTVVLARKNDLAVIDRMSYSGDMNFALLTSPDGVSLERINPEEPSGKRSNWHSAAGNCGFATPGYINSQNMEPGRDDNTIDISPEIFSPDNDGRDDVLLIRLRPGTPGYVANAAVYSSAGILARQLIRNELISSDYTFSWDGITEKNQKAATGIYLIRIDLFTPEGKTEHYTRAAVLGGKY